MIPLTVVIIACDISLAELIKFWNLYVFGIKTFYDDRYHSGVYVSLTLLACKRRNSEI